MKRGNSAEECDNFFVGPKEIVSSFPQFNSFLYSSCSLLSFAECGTILLHRVINKQTCAMIPTKFSLIPDLDQNKEDTTFISTVAYGVYIPLSRPI